MIEGEIAMQRWRMLSIVVGGIVTVFGLVPEAEAIPTFARKYRTSCMTCHTSYPKLNQFGQAFRRNGYRIPGGDNVYVKEEPVYLGAKAWKRIWPNAVWPGSIPSNVPISLMAHNRVRVRENNATSEIDLNLPFEVKLFTGGTLGDNVSFFGEIAFVDDATVELGLGMYYLAFTDLFAERFGQDALNVKLGRLEIAAADGFRKRNRMMIHSYLMGNSGYNVGSSTWDFGDNFSAVEVDGIVKQRFSYALGLTNGEGGLEDVNDAKDLYYRAAYKFGGMAFDGSMGGGFGEGMAESGGSAETSLVLGTFGYIGNSRLTTDDILHDNRFLRIGADARLRFKEFDVSGAYVYGDDRNPSHAGAVDSNAWMVETEYPIYPWMWAGFRAEGVTFNNAKDLVRYVPSLIMLPRANIRLIAEYVLNESEIDGGNQFLVDLSWVY